MIDNSAFKFTVAGCSDAAHDHIVYSAHYVDGDYLHISWEDDEFGTGVDYTTTAAKEHILNGDWILVEPPLTCENTDVCSCAAERFEDGDTIPVQDYGLTDHYGLEEAATAQTYIDILQNFTATTGTIVSIVDGQFGVFYDELEPIYVNTIEELGSVCNAILTLHLAYKNDR